LSDAVNFSDGKAEAEYRSQGASSLFLMNWCAFSTLQVRLLIRYQADRRNAANALNLSKTLFLDACRLVTSDAPRIEKLGTRSQLWRPLGLIALIGLVLGGFLFSGDIALRTFTGHRLFPMAAPTGGTILIVAWLGLAVAAITALIRS
jgi:uncharacterized membrane protein YgdD (TMEM256/DUF423 family)